MSYFPNYPNLRQLARNIHLNLMNNGFTHETQPDRQAIALGEEVGEFLGAYRRWRGMARRFGTVDKVIEELADVIITAYVTAEEFGWDMDQAIEAKYNIIMTRGWREDKHDCYDASCTNNAMIPHIKMPDCP